MNMIMMMKPNVEENRWMRPGALTSTHRRFISLRNSNANAQGYGGRNPEPIAKSNQMPAQPLPARYLAASQPHLGFDAHPKYPPQYLSGQATEAFHAQVAPANSQQDCPDIVKPIPRGKAVCKWDYNQYVTTSKIPCHYDSSEEE